MVENSQRTIYNQELVKYFSCGRHYVPFKNTTLNEKFDILPDTHTPKGFYPVPKYFVIGIGGEEIINDVQGYTMSRHNCIDAALYHHIPFVLRTLDNDLRPSEKKEYRLRNITTINNIDYIAYWGKVTSNVDCRPHIARIETRNGVDVVTQFKTDTDSLLNPVYKNKPRKLTEATSVSTVVSQYSIEFYLSPFDQDELRNVFKILNLDPRTKITELGLCQAYNVVSNGYDEIIDTQIAFHIDLNLDTLVAFDAREPFKQNIVLGGSEPLYI